MTKEAEKFVLDKVMTETVNGFLFAKLSHLIRRESVSSNKEIGLWATPATWLQKYPHLGLNELPP